MTPMDAYGSTRRSLSAADLSACEALMRHGSKSFFAAGPIAPLASAGPGDGALRLLQGGRRCDR
jgi:hypothetical protein